MEEADLLTAARAAIDEFGASAHRVMERRAEAHQRANEPDGEQFWRRVADIVGVLLSDGAK